MQNADDRPLGRPITPEMLARWRARGLGKPGSPAPEVAWRDLKAVWGMYRDGSQMVGMALLENACSPGANILALLFRASTLGTLAEQLPM